MDLLRNSVQPYAWGSATVIPELLGIPNPDGTPQAELWIGAHPAAPSKVERGGRTLTLDAVIAQDPAAELGARVAERFGGRLPFLLKVLAAQKALSIQLHPDRAQAEAGFAAEEKRGVPLTARERVYVDDWPKPEILCALTPFEALAGLRPAEDAADALDGLGVAGLKDLIATLRHEPEPKTVKAVLAELLENPARHAVVDEVVAAAAKASSIDGPYQDAYDAVRRIAADHPGDIGVVCSLLMNHVVLSPGQALYMAAGGVHAYIHGAGIELLANSDNVIRAGLTPKHIDVPELLRVLDPEVPVPILTARQEAPGVERFDTPVPEFLLRRVTAGAEALQLPAASSPRILLCTEGTATVRLAPVRLAPVRLDLATEAYSGPGGGDSDGVRELTLTRGAACFLPASDAGAEVTGPATLFMATPGPGAAA